MAESRIIWPDDHVAVQRIDECIMDLIVVNMLPYSVVEGEAFKRLNIGDPLSAHRYKVKCEKYYRTTLMPATYDKLVKHVTNLLQEATWISFTTDGWSNPTKSCSLLSFTDHFIHDAVWPKVILSVTVLEQDHDGTYLASKLCEAMTKWEIAEKIHVGVRDNAANMKLAMRLAGVTDIGCMSHTLQLVLHDALFTQTSVEVVIKKARKIVTHLKHSEQACRHLVEQQQTVKSPEHSLLQDVETRWNGMYLMLERLVEQRKAVNLYSVQRSGIDSFSLAEWELAARVVKILKPFYTATLEICVDDACISVVILLVSNLNNMLNTTAADQGLKQMKATLRDAMCCRFSDISSSAPFLAATLIDPHFKDTYFNVQKAVAAKKVVLNFLRSVQESAMKNMTAPSAASPIDNVEPGLESSETSESGAQEEDDPWAAYDSQPANVNPSQNFRHSN
ncbi:zinc finger BED domain-containing protein 4-like [Petromyzon marinus]|uniref:zinc finger BED domain-containing protein 4-like n=1 Tax=Petromyzon marinus TaxID=7757 RepID=UPI003F6FDE24